MTDDDDDDDDDYRDVNVTGMLCLPAVGRRWFRGRRQTTSARRLLRRSAVTTGRASQYQSISSRHPRGRLRSPPIPATTTVPEQLQLFARDPRISGQRNILETVQGNKNWRRSMGKGQWIIH